MQALLALTRANIRSYTRDRAAVFWRASSESQTSRRRIAYWFMPNTVRIAAAADNRWVALNFQS